MAFYANGKPCSSSNRMLKWQDDAPEQRAARIKAHQEEIESLEIGESYMVPIEDLKDAKKGAKKTGRLHNVDDAGEDLFRITRVT